MKLAHFCSRYIFAMCSLPGIIHKQVKKNYKAD